MKVKLFTSLLFCIILCMVSGCSKSISSSSQINDSSTTLATDGVSTASPYQSEITSNTGDDKMNNCILIVNGKDITSGNYVKLNQNYAELPFTAVMKALGAEVVWRNKTTAEITYDGKNYILKTTDCSLIEVGGTMNVISTPPGAIRHYQVVVDEFVLDNVTMKGAFQLMETNLKINVNYEDRIVNIH